MFDTLGSQVPGPNPGFEGMVGHLIEFIGYVYSGIIQASLVNFQVISTPLNETPRSRPVPSILPDWAMTYSLGQGNVAFDLGEGRVNLKYSFGGVRNSQHKRYYKTNTRCSGLEIRQNGRLIAHNIFTEVWGKEPHNMYNHVLVIVDLESDKPERLPCTKTSKNGYRQGDKRLVAVYDWVRQHMPDLPKELGNAQDEKDLFEELKNHKNRHVPDPKTVEREKKLFTSLGETKVRADLYLAHGNETILFEGKKDITTVKDAYQLRMYWDGAVQDGLTPTKGTLIAADHPNSVKEVVDLINTMVDVAGNLYQFETVTWKQQGVDYPT
jgi:hypothetical protein